MSNDEERAIEHDCAKLIARYANLNDAADWRGVAALFAPDGRLARPTAPNEWIKGRDAILASFLARPARRTRHLCSNVVVTVTSEYEATAESAMALFLPEDVVKVGSFDDRFVRTEDGWRFAERRGTLTH